MERHLARLANSLRRVYGRALPEGAAATIAAAAQEIDVGRLRLTVSPTPAGLAADVVTAPIERTLVLPSWDRAITLERVEVVGGLGDHKWADRDLLARLEPEPAVRVALLCDSDGAVLEASRGNLFLVRDGDLATPPLDGRILPGVARAVTIEQARAAGLEVREQPVTIENLDDADELFMSGSVRGIEPVRSIVGGREWAPGTVTPHLAERLGRRWVGATTAR